MNESLREELAATLSKHGYSTTELVWLGHLVRALHESIDVVDAEALLRAVIRQPSHFAQSPTTLATNVSESAKLLGLPGDQFLAAATRQPSLLHMRPETVNANVEGSAALLGTTKSQFVTAAMRLPSLLCSKPETLNNNACEAATLLGVGKRQFVEAALKQPALFSQKPTTMNANAERSAAVLGVSKDRFVSAALKQTTLFGLSPETVRQKRDYLEALGSASGEREGAGDIFRQFPTALAYSTNRLHARYILRQQKLSRVCTGSLCTIASARAEQLIIAHYRKQIAITGKGARTLQVLHAKGIITALPDGIAPLAVVPQAPPPIERDARPTAA